MKSETRIKASNASKLLPTMKREWHRCWTRRKQRQLALFLILCTTVGIYVVSNGYRLGFLSAQNNTQNWHSVQSWLANLIAVYYYALPALTIALTFDLWQQENNSNENPRGRLLGRWLWVQTIIILSFISSLVIIFLSAVISGAPFPLAVIASRAVAIWGGAALLGTAIFGFVAFVGLLVRDPHKTMKWGMALLAISIVGLTLLSDILLVNEFGPMPMPGTPVWEAYLETVSQSIGMFIYVFSPTEVFLAGLTYLTVADEFNVWVVVAIWLILALQAGLTWGAAGIFNRLRKKQLMGRETKNAIA